MNDREINARIDRICRNVSRAELLNALHACRPGHPWNVAGVNHFENAAFMLAGGRNGATWADLDWLAKMSKKNEQVA